MLGGGDARSVRRVGLRPRRTRARYRGEASRSSVTLGGERLYLYDDKAPALTRTIKPSGRQELEITDLNRAYLELGELTVEQMGRGATGYDTGTPEALQEAAQFVRALEGRQGLRIGCPEEISWRHGWISTEALERLAHPMRSTGYGRYLLGLASS